MTWNSIKLFTFCLCACSFHRFFHSSVLVTLFSLLIWRFKVPTKIDILKFHTQTHVEYVWIAASVWQEKKKKKIVTKAKHYSTSCGECYQFITQFDRWLFCFRFFFLVLRWWLASNDSIHIFQRNQNKTIFFACLQASWIFNPKIKTQKLLQYCNIGQFTAKRIC